MPNPFSITTATDTIPLDAQGRGSTTFTVSNTSGQIRRGRARLVPSDPGQASWLSVEGESERNFTADGTHQFTVRVAVPPGTPAGSYTSGLDVVSVENPDEEWSQGPKVRFEVAPSQPPKKPFPWWIVAVVVAVLLVVGLTVWLLGRRRGPEPIPTPTPSVVDGTPSPEPAKEILIPAKDYDGSQNAEVGVLPYGDDVVHTGPPYVEKEVFMEYDISFPRTGTYELWVEYAALESRPVTIFLNGNVVQENGLATETGGWTVDHQKWRFQCKVQVDAGTNKLKIYRNGAIPHIRNIKFVPRTP